VTDAELEALEHLRSQYAGVFTDEAIERHLREHVGMDAANDLLHLVRSRRPDAHRILDVGCGYGSFVLVARCGGLEAFGLEPAEFELRWARRRLGDVRPEDDPAAVYLRADAAAVPFEAESFDAVCFWNVVEHLPNAGRALAEAARVLRPGGSLFLIAPNYAAFRREAHYHVPWPPLLPRRLAVVYLRALGRNPSFYEDDVHPSTMLGTVRTLGRLGLELRDPRVAKLSDVEAVRRPSARSIVRWMNRLRLAGLARAALRAQMVNPLRPTISVEAVKRP
jgi:MPBQ/MSBQ methyltransferase